MATNKPIYAFDFDGVICDSVNESIRSGLRGAKEIWGDDVLSSKKNLPSATSNSDSEVPSWLETSMRTIRPVIETGWENILLVKYIIDRVAQDGLDNVDRISNEILEGWLDGLKEEVLEGCGEDIEGLVETFGNTRDSWIEQDKDGWLSANRFYPGVVEMLNGIIANKTDFFIITTKQDRFVRMLLERNGVKAIKEDQIFGLGSGSKISVLKGLVMRKEFGKRVVDFVEDRYETLEAVSLSMLGQPLRLYLATWGYNTERNRERAEKHPFIGCLELQQMTENFQ